MELSKLVLDGITFAGDPTIISNPIFTKLLPEVFRIILVSQDPSAQDSAMESFNEKSKGLIKQTLASLITLIIEAAKHDLDGQMFKAQLDECQFEESRAKELVNLYDSNKPKIQAVLANYGNQHPHIVNVDWRQDFVVKSNLLSRVGQLRYIIELETETTNSKENEKVSFSCTLEDLQTLVDKLKDASRSLTRNSQV